MNNNFLIIGNGGSGTSLMRGLLNAHSGIDCLFEDKGGGKHDEMLRYWLSAAEGYENGKLWGNKIPFEQFLSTGWLDEQIIELIDNFKIVWIVRRYSMYHKGRVGPYEENWKRSNSVYWAMRERDPASIINVSFEDLVFRPCAELERICAFLDVAYEDEMLKGTLDTGYGRYNQGNINPERA